MPGKGPLDPPSQTVEMKYDIVKSLTVRTRLILALTVILLFGFVSTNLISYRVSRQTVRTGIIENSLPLARDNIYSEIQRDLMRPTFVSSLMANDTFLKDWVLNGEKDVKQITRYLTEMKEKYGFFTSFFISEKSRHYYHFQGILKKISPEDAHDVWYFNFKKLNVPHDLDVDTNEAHQNRLTIFINHRLEDYEGRFLGVVGVGLDFDVVADLLDYYREKYNRRVYMVSPDGLIQVHTDKKYILTTNIRHQEGIGEIADTLLATRSASFYEYDADGHHILLTCRYIDELGWFLLVEQDENEALASLRKTLFRNLLFGLFITVCTIGITILTINYFQKRLERLAITDTLTRAFNRNGFEQRFTYAAGLARRKRVQLAIILFDLDHFKSLNDSFGHQFGDKVLIGIADLAHALIRENDSLVRWGGDEFIILLLGDLRHARTVTERLREAIAEHDFYRGENIAEEKRKRVSISCGLAGFHPEDDMDSLTARADAALYDAKRKGRDRVMDEEECAPGHD